MDIRQLLLFTKDRLDFLSSHNSEKELEGIPVKAEGLLSAEQGLNDFLSQQIVCDPEFDKAM